ncbi:MAG: sigma-70 family RNA polymerase sigma factor, partial [Planctomycetes bacterium]|nr:sigma-70 family RNA polymerase sigma factor [Planctomycetota bacterium]
DAEDAFQATFIALARKAGEVRPESVAGWLQKVSCEVALNARKAAQRRDAAQRRLVERAAAGTGDPQPDEELRAAVAEEVAALPERLRVPLTLYYLEGKTQAEIGRILGVTDRAAAHRLKQALKLLRDRLSRRGVAVTAGVLAAVLGNVPVTAAAPSGLFAHTTALALAVAAGGPSDTVAAQLALEVTRASGWVRLKLCSLVLVPALCAIVGSALLAQRPAAVPPDAPAPRAATASPSVGDGPPADRFGDPLPAGAVTRLGTLRFRTGNPGGLSSVAFGPGGKALVSAHGGDTIHFWEPDTGREVRKLDAPSSCWAVSATPDGKRLVAVGASEVWAFDLSAALPKVLWKAPAKLAGPGTVELSPDGRLIACGGDVGREIRLLDADKGTVVRTLPDRGCRFTFSADSKSLASWTWSRSTDVCVWDVATGTKRHALVAGTEREAVSSVAFSPDGKLLATVGQDRRLRVWDTDKGTERHRLAEDADPHAFAGFAPDGTLVEVSGGRVRHWDAAAGRAKSAVKSVESAWSTAYRLSADGTRVAAAWPFGVGVWDLATGRELGAAAGMPDGFIHPVCFNRDGTALVTASFSEAAGARVQLWDAADGRPRRRFEVPPRQLVWSFDFAPDGALSAALGALTELPPKPPERIAQWTVDTGTARPELRLPAETRAVALAPDGKHFAVASADAVSLCDRETGREVKKFSGRCSADSLAFSAVEGSLAALDTAAGRVTVWSLADGREWTWPPASAGQKKRAPLRPPVALSPDGRLLAVGSAEPKAGIRLVDVTTGTELLPLDGQSHGWAFQEFAFAPDGRTIASAGADGVVRVWEVAGARERYRFAGHRSAVLAVAFSPDGRRLASSSMDSTALVWDVSTPQKPAPADRPTAAQLWAALTGPDAAAAHRAIVTLAATPNTAVPLLKERLALPPASAEQVRRWLDDLGSDQFAVREAATEELARRGDLLGPE